MQDKGKKNLNKYLIQASSAEDVITNHAYAEVARSHKPIPKRRPQTDSAGSPIVPSYKGSMVGSISQYQNTVPIPKEQSDVTENNRQDQDGVIGNRPRSGTDTRVSNSDQASIERRHHFIEPPKRNFNRFD